MKHFSLFLLTLVVSLNVAAQEDTTRIQEDTTTLYFDKLWKPAKKRSDAAFYRTVAPRDGKYFVQDHYISGQLLMEALCTAYQPTLQWDAVTRFYHANGAVAEEGPFKNEARYGFHRFWYDNGAPWKEVFYGKKDPVYHNYWSPSGEQLLTNGNGFIGLTELGANHFAEVENFKQGAVFVVEGKDTVYLSAEVPPEYDGGYAQLTQDIPTIMKYPKAAWKDQVGGTVYLQFLVGKQGETSDFKILRGVRSDCDAEALRVAKALKHWLPGYHKNRPVAMMHTLPIKFIPQR
jgi:protein TonB